MEGSPSFFSEETIVNYGRTAVVSLLGFVWFTSLNRQSADVQHAIRGLLPQGFDRSILAAKLQSQKTKSQMNSLLDLESLREQLRDPSTTKVEKGRCLRKLWKRVIIGLVTGVYIHALTIALFCVKNSVRVLCFVLQKREAEEWRKRQGRLHKGDPSALTPLGIPPDILETKNGTMLSTWWHHGWKGVLQRRLLSSQGIVEEMLNDGPASPFTSNLADEECGILMDFTNNESIKNACEDERMQEKTRQDWSKKSLTFSNEDGTRRERRKNTGSPLLAANNASLNFTSPSIPSLFNFPVSSCLKPWVDGTQSATALVAALEEAFSVNSCIEAAIPRVMKTVEKVVTRVFEADPSLLKKFAPTAVVKQEDVSAVWDTLITATDKEMCVREWLMFPLHVPPSTPAQASSSYSFPAPVQTRVNSKKFEGSASTLHKGDPSVDILENRSNGTQEHPKEDPEAQTGITPASSSLGLEAMGQAGEVGNAEEIRGKTADTKNTEDNDEDEDGQEVHFGQLHALQQKAAEAEAVHQLQHQYRQDHGGSDVHCDVEVREYESANNSVKREDNSPLGDNSLPLPLFPSSAPVSLPSLSGSSSPGMSGQGNLPQLPSTIPTKSSDICSQEQVPRDAQQSLPQAVSNTSCPTPTSSFFPAADRFMKAVREKMTVEEEMVEPITSLFLLAECFRNVIQNVSFSELVLEDSRRMLFGLSKKASNFKHLSSFNPETNTARMPMISTYFESLRQRLADEDFVIQEYLSLFCTELVRHSTTRQR